MVQGGVQQMPPGCRSLNYQKCSCRSNALQQREGGNQEKTSIFRWCFPNLSHRETGVFFSKGLPTSTGLQAFCAWNLPRALLASPQG